MKHDRRNKIEKQLNSNEQNRMVEDQLFILNEVVNDFMNSGESAENLKKAGYIGLLNAIHLYQNEEEELFQRHARQLIAGEIRHYIREKYKKVEVPVWLEALNKYINQVILKYHQEFKRYPDIQDLSKLTNLSVEALEEALKARESVHQVSIDQNRRMLDIQKMPDFKKIKKEIKQKKYDE